MSNQRMEQSTGLQGGHRFVGRLAGRQLECSAMGSSARWHRDVEENVLFMGRWVRIWRMLMEGVRFELIIENE